MAKKSVGKVSKTTTKKGMGADYHRKMAQEHSARARLHGAKADLIDAQNPGKKKGPGYLY